MELAVLLNKTEEWEGENEEISVSSRVFEGIATSVIMSGCSEEIMFEAHVLEVLEPPSAAGMSVCFCCQQEIVDRFILRVHPDREFHASCLKCRECSRLLDGTCFVRDDLTYCKEDYQRLFAPKCVRCTRPFARDEMVMRARDAVFHVECFSCVACNHRLSTGDEFQLRGDQLYCKADCDCGNMPEPSSMRTPSFADEDAWETCTMTSLDPTSSPPLSVRSPKSDELAPNSGGFYSSSCSGGGGKKKKDKQTTRVRTVLNENQLLILKKCYNLNPRPDALLKEQLVEMTGLNARVIRVWFQNKRCKDKKRQIQLRDFHVNAEKERALNHVRVTGVGPLVAAPPSTHTDGLGAPLDISHFPQWGSTGTEHDSFAMGYTELLPDLSGGYGVPAGFQDFSPHLQGSDLSSPSCSE